MLQQCTSCPGKEHFKHFLIKLFEEDDYELDDKICYKQWIHELIELSANFF